LAAEATSVSHRTVIGIMHDVSQKKCTTPLKKFSLQKHFLFLFFIHKIMLFTILVGIKDLIVPTFVWI